MSWGSKPRPRGANKYRPGIDKRDDLPPDPGIPDWHHESHPFLDSDVCLSTEARAAWGNTDGLVLDVDGERVPCTLEQPFANYQVNHGDFRQIGRTVLLSNRYCGWVFDLDARHGTCIYGRETADITVQSVRPFGTDVLVLRQPYKLALYRDERRIADVGVRGDTMDVLDGGIVITHGIGGCSLVHVQEDDALRVLTTERYDVAHFTKVYEDGAIGFESVDGSAFAFVGVDAMLA